MQINFWPNFSDFPSTRESAKARLIDFEKTASRYSRDRNYVVPRHTNVSRLSPAIRHRLITEKEVAQYIMHRYAFSTVEKFLQEVYWGRYWKSWLALRPAIWQEYLQDLSNMKTCDTARQVMSGESEVMVMNDFARELIEAGYLHNHARMWFAGYWIHKMELPWQLGADFFYSHLLDADPAANTLSWRWVAGLQTRGKTYLARKSNIEKYLHPDLLKGRGKGLDQLVGYQSVKPANFIYPEIQQQELSVLAPDLSVKSGFWMHLDDLSVSVTCKDVFLSDDPQRSDLKSMWVKQALDDVESRLREHCIKRAPTCDLVSWAEKNRLKQVIAYHPEIGEFHDKLETLKKGLQQVNIDLVLIRREEDLESNSLATAGFFGFWKKIEPSVRALK